MDPDDKTAVLTVLGGLALATALLAILTMVFKFKFVIGVGD